MTEDSRAAHRRHIRVGAMAAVTAGGVALAVHGATSCRTVFFGDSGELIAAAGSLGVAHPTGYPLYVLLGHLALQVPVGEPALRMNLLSALFGALACAGAAWMVQRWTGSLAAALGGALSLAFAPTFWRASTAAEVYTLHLALIGALWIGCFVAGTSSDARARRRALLAAGVALGLGLSHRPTILLALPAALVLIWSLSPHVARVRPGGSVGNGRPGGGLAPYAVLALVFALAIPLVFYGAMLLRSQMNPVANWGRPDDLQSLLIHVTARRYQTYALGAAGWLRPEAWRDLAGLLWSGFGALTLPLAALGCIVALLGRMGNAARRGGIAVLVLVMATTLFGLSYATEDVEVLFLPLFYGMALAVGLGIGAVGSTLRGSFKPVVWLLAAGAATIPFVAHLPRANLRPITAAADFGRDMLATVPRNGALFVDGDEAFLLAYLQQVLGEREDVRVYHRRGVLFREELSERGSERGPRESAAGFRVRRELEFLVRESRSASPMPVMFMTWPGYALPPGLRFEPIGLFYLVRPGGKALDPAPLWKRYREARVHDQALELGDPFGLALAASYPLMRGERALFEGHRSAAFEFFDQASRLAPDSESIHNYLGAIYGRGGEYTRAVAELEIAVRIKPVSVRAWNNLAQARLLAGDREGAVRAWGRSLALLPGQAEIERRIDELAVK
jgi:tetratricopeptide (TPR) repeat protein